MAEIRMPKMGDGMEEGTINVWHKKEGDMVTTGEVIAEVETDKANVEISAYETGTLSKIVVAQGQTVPVGEVIAILGDAAVTNGGNGKNGSHAVSDAKPVSSEGVADYSAEEGTTTPVVPEKAEPTLVNASAGTRVSGEEGERVKSSPLARRIAEDLGVDLAAISGTGPNGRIKESDVRAFADKGVAAPKLRPAVESVVSTVSAKPAVEVARAAAVSPMTPMQPVAAGEDIKPTKMREAIARRTVLSKTTIPHFYVTMIVEMDRALALLKELNVDATDGKITVNDIIVKACAVALGKCPEVNSTWTPEGMIHRYAEANIGIAVGIEDGLIIPVVRDCHTKPLRTISSDAKALIVKAKNNQLVPSDYSGGTFTVSNLGMMGADEFIALINPPEAAILAVGAAVREPVVGANDEIKIKTRMKITLSADHRLLDGVSGAKFLQEVKKGLEAPFSLLS